MAEAAFEAIADVVKTGACSGRNELATKADLAALELRMTNKLYAVAGALAALIVAAKLIP